MDYIDIDKEREKQLCLFPIKHHDIWGLYKKAVACFWVPDEIDLSEDVIQWQHLDNGTKHFIKHVLGFFAGADAIVNINLASFMNTISCNEAQCFYSFQNSMENIHSEMYALLIDTYITDTLEKEHLFEAHKTIPCIKKKADWAMRWLSDDASFSDRLVAFACVEGIFFSSAFASIFWIREEGKMPGLALSNELISRDEGLHCTMACMVFQKIKSRTTDNIVFEIVDEAVKLEKEFISDAIPVGLLGINYISMGAYIEYVADHLLFQLINKKKYNASNPFPFMDNISMDGKTNFFERRVGEYQKSGALATKGESTFRLDDF